MITLNTKRDLIDQLRSLSKKISESESVSDNVKDLITLTVYATNEMENLIDELDNEFGGQSFYDRKILCAENDWDICPDCKHYIETCTCVRCEICNQTKDVCIC